MIGLVMAGGKGTRMKLSDEKLLLKYKKPIILHVLDSLQTSNCFSKIIAVTSSNSPKTKKFLHENNIETLDTPGLGYVEDLNSVLKLINDFVFVTSGDLPLLDKEIIQLIVNNYDSQNVWISILVTSKFLKTLGINSDYSINFNGEKCHYSGISLVNAEKISTLDKVDENYMVIDDKKIAFNLNTKSDYDLLSTA